VVAGSLTTGLGKHSAPGPHGSGGADGSGPRDARNGRGDPRGDHLRFKRGCRSKDDCFSTTAVDAAVCDSTASHSCEFTTETRKRVTSSRIRPRGRRAGERARSPVSQRWENPGSPSSAALPLLSYAPRPPGALPLTTRVQVRPTPLPPIPSARWPTPIAWGLGGTRELLPDPDAASPLYHRSLIHQFRCVFTRISPPHTHWPPNPPPCAGPCRVESWRYSNHGAR